MKDRGTLTSMESLIEVYMNANEPQKPRYDYSWATEILDADYNHTPENFDDVIRTCENLLIPS
jgi:hypothetical protein